MAIKALIKIVEYDKKGNIIEYKPGTTITSLSEEEEKRLVKIQAAEAITIVNESADPSNKESNTNSNEGESSEGNGPSTGYPSK